MRLDSMWSPRLGIVCDARETEATAARRQGALPMLSRSVKRPFRGLDTQVVAHIAACRRGLSFVSRALGARQSGCCESQTRFVLAESDMEAKQEVK